MIELQGKFGKDCKIFANTIENEAIGTNVQEIKELIEPTVDIIDTIVPLINIKAV